MEKKSIAPLKVQTQDKVFYVLQGSLTKYPDSKLAKTFSDENISQIKLDDGSIFLDRNSQYFSIILDFLRGGVIPFIGEKDLDMVFEEFNYWELPLPNDDRWGFESSKYDQVTNRSIQLYSELEIEITMASKRLIFFGQRYDFRELPIIMSNTAQKFIFDSRKKIIKFGNKEMHCPYKQIQLRIECQEAKAIPITQKAKNIQ